jgi:hypothetical protein
MIFISKTPTMTLDNSTGEDGSYTVRKSVKKGGWGRFGFTARGRGVWVTDRGVCAQDEPTLLRVGSSYLQEESMIFLARSVMVQISTTNRKHRNHSTRSLGVWHTRRRWIESWGMTSRGRSHSPLASWMCDRGQWRYGFGQYKFRNATKKL